MTPGCGGAASSSALPIPFPGMLAPQAPRVAAPVDTEVHVWDPVLGQLALDLLVHVQETRVVRTDVERVMGRA